jgi:hypothetical protein
MDESFFDRHCHRCCSSDLLGSHFAGNILHQVSKGNAVIKMVTALNTQYSYAKAHFCITVLHDTLMGAAWSSKSHIC